MVDVGRRGRFRQRGIGRITSQPFRPDGGDIDLDASMDALAEARDGWCARPRAPADPGMAQAGHGRVLARRSQRVDGRSSAGDVGCGGGRRRACAADYSVLASAPTSSWPRPRTSPSWPTGRDRRPQPPRFGTTDLVGALRAATGQLRSTAGRRIVVLLSDCRATVPGDVLEAARALDELCIVAPADLPTRLVPWPC